QYLDSSRFALAAIENFLVGYRSYAQVAAKRRADRVLAAHDEYETAMKEILSAEGECDLSLAELARLMTELQRIGLEEDALEAEITAFQQSPHMKDAQAIEQAHHEAVERRKDAESAVAELTDAGRALKTFTEEHLRLRTLLEEIQARLTTAMDT